MACREQMAANGFEKMLDSRKNMGRITWLMNTVKALWVDADLQFSSVVTRKEKQPPWGRCDSLSPRNAAQIETMFNKPTQAKIIISAPRVVSGKTEVSIKMDNNDP